MERTFVDKQAWLLELGQVILEANNHLWADAGKEVAPFLPGFQTLVWEKPDSPWKVVDQYAGYFRAPGFTVVYYKGQPVWTNAYAGQGQDPSYYSIAGATFDFLKRALKDNSDPNEPFRGSCVYNEHNTFYSQQTEGTIEDGRWEEIVGWQGGQRSESHFTQRGVGGIVIGRNVDGSPALPWEL